MIDKTEKPQSYYGNKDELWVCVFPGKMGISWKVSSSNYNRHEAETEAKKFRNAIAIPLALWLRYKEYEQRSVASEQKLMEELNIRVDYVDDPDGFYGKPIFTKITYNKYEDPLLSGFLGRTDYGNPYK